ncbi:type II toxin-antitoxin system RelE/ParE family toxin [Lentibacillus cibarius]|uniref:Type II toxin-antitoxin system RelE/ParE family toxin n=1 Tax=Lentibacillus cibarius TaxID=2583219 RepID=A0A5S3QFP1_9BACI|nr:type II toxin-antitoxin system RelE/ParE family toxin [Lentibacillus cibarius]TMN18807.1 type II toxin-antitoxin system RelE/ParE family toxin [Lentibacillus cibarius]TMN18835.1 type II toxin-antitoxin system RelE/ParE family toxin [Lentibacillus cibarius]
MLPVAYLNPAKRYFKKLKEKPLKKQFDEAIHHIRLNPYVGEPKTGDLAGIYSYNIPYKGTQYRLAYRIAENDTGELIVVILAGTRETFYQELKHFMNS